MSFNWIGFFHLATKLSDQAENSEDSEADLRSSISRAYYATFNKARQHLNDKWGITISSGGKAHRQVIIELKRKQKHKIAKRLRLMRADRNKADYDIEFDGNLENVARETIKRAKYIISRLA